MKPDDVRIIRKRLGVTQAELAALLGVTRETVTRWETGVRRVSPLAARLLVRIRGEKGRGMRQRRKK